MLGLKLLKDEVEDFDNSVERDWLAYRYGDTYAIVDGEPQVISFYDDYVVINDERHSWEDVKGTTYVGVPKHGYSNNTLGAMYHSRNFYRKYKWGWQPRNDTIGPDWRSLARPNHVPYEQAVISDDVMAVSYDFAISKTEVFYQDSKVAEVKEGVPVINEDNDWLLYDSRFSDITGGLLDEYYSEANET